MKFSIIATGYNCEKFAKECIESVLNQTYTDWELLIYNDASTDKTSEICEPYSQYNGKIWTYNAPENKGALYGRYTLTRIASGDVVCFLGLDDKLTPNALEVLNGYYTDEVKMTWGSWMTEQGRGTRAINYSDDVWKTKRFRRAAWRATALNTFRRELLLSVPKEKLMHEGKFFDNCTDLAYSFPCLEQLERNEVRVVKEFIYIYRQHGNTTLGRLGKAHKTRIREILKNV